MLPLGEYHVPAIAVELRLATELMRDRPDRYGPIVSWIREHGCDTDLLGAAMDARDIPAEMRNSIHDQIN